MTGDNSQSYPHLDEYLKGLHCYFEHESNEHMLRLGTFLGGKLGAHELAQGD